jgi:hypothetical protein
MSDKDMDDNAKFRGTMKEQLRNRALHPRRASNASWTASAEDPIGTKSMQRSSARSPLYCLSITSFHPGRPKHDPTAPKNGWHGSTSRPLLHLLECKRKKERKEGRKNREGKIHWTSMCIHYGVESHIRCRTGMQQWHRRTMDTEGIDHHALDAEHITSFFCCIIGQEQHQDTTCMHVPREDCNKWKERLTSCATTSNNRQRKERQNIKHMENAKAEATVTQRGTNTHRSRSSVPP